MTKRYGVEVHAYVLMSNHYHLLVRAEVKGSRLHCASEVQRKGEVSNGNHSVTALPGE
jgi:REP element-mobilizing transposase RayT